MRISVVIPVHNEQKYIHDCLKSLTEQEVKPDEIIVVDSYSTDSSQEVIKKFPVKLLEGTFKDVIAARDFGFNQAQFDIIARIDADTRAPSNWIKIIKKTFEENVIDALTGPSDFYDTPFGSVVYYKVFLAAMEKILGYSILLGTNMALTKKIWETIKNETCTDPKSVHEDIDLAVHIHEHRGVIRYNPHLITHTSFRRQRQNPISFFGEYPYRLVKTIRTHRKTASK